MSKKNRVYLL